MKAQLKQVEGLTFTAKADSNHWTIMDGPKTHGGAEAGSKPMEMVLMALGGCTSMDVLSILKKKKVDVKNYEVELDAEKASEHPAVFTKIHLKYIVYGKNIDPSDVERAIELSMDKYCSVSAMLKKTAEVTTEFEIREP